MAFQEAVIFWLGGLSSPALDNAMGVATASYLVVIPAVVLAVSLTKRKNERRPVLYRAIGSVLLAYLLVTLAKDALDAPRPCAVLPVRTPVGCEQTGSFPSAHAALVFSVLPFLSGGGAAVYFVYSALVGLSRIYLGVHYPVDVVAGAIVGFAVGVLFSGKAKPASQSAPPSR